MANSKKSQRLAKLPALSPANRISVTWAYANSDRDRLLELCQLLPGRKSSLITVLWPLYMLGSEKNRELRGSHAQLQAALGSKLSPKTFITTLATLKEHGLIHVDVQCEKGQSKKFTRIGVREGLYVIMLNTRQGARFQDKYPAWDLYTAVRVVSAGEEELSLGRLTGHSDAQRSAITAIISMVRDNGLSYGHIAVLRIMHEKFLELKAATGWNPKFPFYHALEDGEKRYWPNVLKVFKEKDGIQFITTWAYCAYLGREDLFGNNHNIHFTADEWPAIKDFMESECGHSRGDLLLTMNDVGDVTNGKRVLRKAFLRGYEDVQSAPSIHQYLHDLFSWD